jgi:hypothetical protein
MRALRVYVDTSVIGGCEDPEFAERSRAFFEYVRQGNLIVVVSPIVVAELAGAPESVRAVLRELPLESVQYVELDAEMLALRDAYIRASILGPRWIDDAAHVAVATVIRADAIVSWNFKHLVRLDRIRAFNQVNLMNGYGILSILTPMEVWFDDCDESEAV